MTLSAPPLVQTTIRLSRRETEVLIQLSHGLSDKEVAEVLGITLGTVRVYRKRMSSKLGARGLVQCLLVAWALGLIDVRPIVDRALANAAVERARIRTIGV